MEILASLTLTSCNLLVASGLARILARLSSTPLGSFSSFILLASMSSSSGADIALLLLSETKYINFTDTNMLQQVK